MAGDLNAVQSGTLYDHSDPSRKENRSGIQPHDADLDIHDLRRSINEELDFKARVGERYGIALR